MLKKAIKITFFTLMLGTPVHAQTYEGFDCSDDCSGHRAGYEWAMENEITDENDCGGNSRSFIEGCIAFTENPDRTDTSVDDDGNFISN